MKKLFFVLSLIVSAGLFAQDEEQSAADNLHLTVNFETSHLWRGLIISDQPDFNALMSYDLDRAKTLSVGIWGATSVSRDDDGTHYKEIDYFLQYSNKGLTIGIWDLFNTRSVDPAVASDNIWNYSKSRTNHILDLRTSYQFQNNFPLRLEFDVMLYGGAGAGEVIFKPTGKYDKNRYSSYVEASYPLINKETLTLTGFVGGGFAFNPVSGNTFLYGDGKHDFEIVNMGLTASKKVHVFNQSVPIMFMTMWNPALKYARIQLGTSFTVF